MSYENYVAGVGDKSVYRVLVGRLKKRGHLEDRSVDER